MKLIITEKENCFIRYNEPDETILEKNKKDEWMLHLWFSSGVIRQVNLKKIQWIHVLYQNNESYFSRKIVKSFYEHHPELRDKLLDEQIAKLAREKANRKLIYEYEEKKKEEKKDGE